MFLAEEDHKSRSASLCPSTATAFTTLSRSGRTSVTSRLSARSSTVSIRLPGACVEQNDETLMYRRSTWGNLRGSVLSIRKLFLVAPCSRHKCCLGCISLHDAVPLICVVEILLLSLFTLIAVDLYLTDGTLFFTTEMKGCGNSVAVFYSAFLFISVSVIGLTLFAWYFRKKKLYLAHILWQWTTLEILAYFSYKMIVRCLAVTDSNTDTFLFPSAVVLLTVSVLLMIIQAWWLFVFIDAMFFKNSHARSSSVVSKNFDRGRVNISKTDMLEVDSVEIIKSQRQGLAVPTVKLRRPSEDSMARRKSAEEESVYSQRSVSVMEEIPEF